MFKVPQADFGGNRSSVPIHLTNLTISASASIPLIISTLTAVHSLFWASVKGRNRRCASSIQFPSVVRFM